MYVCMYVCMYVWYVCMYVCMYVCTVDAKLKFPFRIRSTLSNVITEDTLEPCHLRLVLLTSPTIFFFCLVILTAASAKAIRLVDKVTRL